MHAHVCECGHLQDEPDPMLSKPTQREMDFARMLGDVFRSGRLESSLSTLMHNMGVDKFVKSLAATLYNRVAAQHAQLPEHAKTRPEDATAQESTMDSFNEWRAEQIRQERQRQQERQQQQERERAAREEDVIAEEDEEEVGKSSARNLQPWLRFGVHLGPRSPRSSACRIPTCATAVSVDSLQQAHRDLGDNRGWDHLPCVADGPSQPVCAV